jgi:hypothetical protein
LFGAVDFKFLRLAGAKNEPLLRFAVAGSGAFLFCLLALVAVLCWELYRTGNL